MNSLEDEYAEIRAGMYLLKQLKKMREYNARIAEMLEGHSSDIDAQFMRHLFKRAQVLIARLEAEINELFNL